MRDDHRIPISLACAECGARNYRTTRRVREGEQRLELKKFCASCKKHTVHRETK
ncbi:MAG TPA: 50S ribosomal protein L33 [Polyangiaceae bacterium]|nr:50S ribosomal protein L33 [Polyangiaceae bacterium]